MVNKYLRYASLFFVSLVSLLIIPSFAYAVGATSCPLVIPTPVQTAPVVNVKNFGATGNGSTDDTAAIQNALNSMTSGGTLVFPAGTYKYTAHMSVSKQGTKLWGYGATLHNGVNAPHPFALDAANTAVYGFRFTTASITRGSGIHGQIGVYGAGQQVIDNTLIGPSVYHGLGFTIWGASDFLIARNHVENTAADSIWIVGGSRNGKVLCNTVRNAGDDMIGIVSTVGWPINDNILVQENDVAHQGWGRGLTVVGGKNVTLRNNKVSDTYAAAGIYIAQEDNFNTWEVNNVLIEGNDIDRVQTTGAPRPGGSRTNHPGIILWGNSKLVQNVMIRNNTLDNVINTGIGITSQSCRVGIQNNAMSGIPNQAIYITSPVSPSCNVACSGNTDEGAPTSNARCGGAMPTVTGSWLTATYGGSPPPPPPPPPPPGSATLSGSPSSVVPGGTVTVTWSGVASPTVRDWLSRNLPGDADNVYSSDWKYTSACTQAAGATAKSFGSCAFAMPATAGTYQFRLFANNGFSKLATSNSVAVSSTPPPPPPAAYTISASPSTVAPGGTITVNWTAPSTHSATDWVSIFAVGQANTTCGSGCTNFKHIPAGTSGAVTLTAGNSVGTPLAPGTYEVRYLLNDGYTEPAPNARRTVTVASGT